MTEIGEKTAGRKKASMSSDDPDYKSTMSKVLQIYVYSTKDVSNHVFLFSNYARKARNMLTEHRLDLRAYPGLPTIMGDNDLIVDWGGKIETRLDHQEIAKLSQKRAPTPDDALPVILCQVTDKVGDNAESVEIDGRPFVFIYGNHPSADKVTLLHEIGHAADCRYHPPWGLGRADKRYDFMATPGDLASDPEALAKTKDPAYYRNTIFKPDVLKLAGAKFAVNRGLCFYPPLFVGG
jgi:hypothetical protein